MKSTPAAENDENLEAVVAQVSKQFHHRLINKLGTLN
jgi:hypothetical protein